MTRAPTVLVLSLLVSAPTVALERPRRAALDSHIQTVRYHEGDVVQINSYPGIATQVVLAPDEKVLNMASGFTKGWDIFQRENHIFIKPRSVKQGEALLEPKAGQWNTNLVVTTTRRLYTFVLQLQPPAKDPFTPPASVAYRVVFRYPGDEAAAARRKAAIARANGQLTARAAPRNWNYSMQVAPESDAIAPAMAYDDGRFTYLRFPGNREMPAVFVVAADKTESLVNSHIDPEQPDILVVHRVAPELALRLGNQAVGVFNDAYDAEGLPPVDGTTVPGVARRRRSAPPRQGDS